MSFILKGQIFTNPIKIVFKSLLLPWEKFCTWNAFLFVWSMVFLYIDYLNNYMRKWVCLFMWQCRPRQKLLIDLFSFSNNIQDPFNEILSKAIMFFIENHRQASTDFVFLTQTRYTTKPVIYLFIESIHENWDVFSVQIKINFIPMYWFVFWLYFSIKSKWGVFSYMNKDKITWTL